MSKMTVHTARDFQAGKARREKFIAELKKDPTVPQVKVCERIPIHPNTLYAWKKNYKDFAAIVESIVRPGTAIKANTAWTTGFAEFRRTFFGHESPWFHLRIIDALEKTSGTGSVTLITIPPEHGKTTLLEDWVCYKLALDPTFRITVGSETVTHARKFIGRVQGRMDVEGPVPKYVYRFGPFIAPKGTEQARRQTWTQDRMSVFKKGRFDERDYSLSGLGMTGKIRGTRTDLLIVDDPQSEETLAQSAEMFRKFRHDWLSRPGADGDTVILMTRVGEGDFADLLLDSEILDTHIRIPAWTEEHGWLWPERYTEEKYDRMKRNVGEDGWDLSYMQIARPAHTIVFTKDTIEKGRDGLRTTLHVDRRMTGRGIMVGLDPGYGVTAITAAADVPGEAPAGSRFEILTARKHRNLAGTEDIVAALEDVIHAVHLQSHPVTDLVIETNAFQKGLLLDPGILRLQGTFGFRIHPHQSSQNKTDRDLGIPQMVHSLLREEITWPWADEHSRRELGELEADMYRWRPGKKGTEIEQDALMATWFIWLLWRARNTRVRQVDTSQFRSAAAPPLMVGGVR